MESSKKPKSSEKNVLITSATLEGKTTNFKTINLISPSRSFTAEDAGLFRLTEAEFSKIKILKN